MLVKKGRGEGRELSLGMRNPVFKLYAVMCTFLSPILFLYVFVISYDFPFLALTSQSEKKLTPGVTER